MKKYTDHDAMRLASWAVILFWVIVLACCYGCGGGSDETDQFVGPPDCKAHPELCR